MEEFPPWIPQGNWEPGNLPYGMVTTFDETQGRRWVDSKSGFGVYSRWAGYLRMSSMMGKYMAMMEAPCRLPLSWDVLIRNWVVLMLLLQVLVWMKHFEGKIWRLNWRKVWEYGKNDGYLLSLVACLLVQVLCAYLAWSPRTVDLDSFFSWRREGIESSRNQRVAENSLLNIYCLSG